MNPVVPPQFGASSRNAPSSGTGRSRIPCPLLRADPSQPTETQRFVRCAALGMYFCPSLRRLTPTGGSLRERIRAYFFPVVAFGLYHQMIFLRVMGGMSSRGFLIEAYLHDMHIQYHFKIFNRVLLGIAQNYASEVNLLSSIVAVRISKNRCIAAVQWQLLRQHIKPSLLAKPLFIA